MAKIKMPKARFETKSLTFEETFNIFLTDSVARGLTKKILKTYREHLHSISLFLDISTPIGSLTRNRMNEMIVLLSCEWHVIIKVPNK